jgi:hypothetical protein
VLWLQNELGWRLHKKSSGYMIRRTSVPLHRRIPQFGPVLLNVVYAFFWWRIEDEKLNVALFVIPFTLFLGCYMFRPAVMYINTRSCLVMDGSFFPRFPFSRVKMESEYVPDIERHRVYLRDTEPSYKILFWKTNTKWKCLAWECNTEAEVSRVVEEFSAQGIKLEAKK